MRRVLVIVVEIAGFGLLGLAALITSVLLHLEVPLARRGVGTWLSDVVSGAIRGALVISHIERMSPGIIVARGVILFDGEGHRIAYGERLTLKPDWDELLHLRVAFSSARLENAQVQLIDKGDGLPTLVTTFDSQTPHPHTGKEPLHVTVDGIELWQVTLSGDLLGLNGFRADDLHALGRLDIGSEVYARIDHAHATLNRPFGFPGVVDSLTGVISTAPKDGIYLRARTHRGNERASGSVRYALPKDDPKAVDQRLTIRVRGTDVSISSLHGLGYDWAPDIAVPISGRFVLDGPTDNFEITAKVQTSAGDADVRGSITDATGVSVSLRTEAMKLAEVFPDYPNVTARGLLRIEAKPGVVDPTLHAEVEPVMFGSIALPAFNADGAMLDAGLRIDRLQARSKTARVDGHGKIAKNGALEFDIVASFPEIANEMNLRKAVPNARGRLDADLHIATPQIGMTKLNLSGRVTLRNFRYARLEADRLELRGSARGDPEHPQLSVRVTGAQVRVDDYVLGDPTLALQGGPRAYTADGQFASAGKRTFNMHAQIRAERDAFTIDADPIEFAVGNGSWRGALSGLRIVSDKAVELGNLRLASRSQRLEARGVLRFAGDDELQAELQDFDLEALHALLGDRMLLSHGRADAHLELTGDIKDPEVHLQGALRNGVVQGIAGVNALYLIAYSAGRIEANGEVDLANRGLFRVDGSGEIDRTLADPLRALELGTYDVALNGQAIDLGLVPKLHAAKVTGTLGCELRFQGAPQDPIVSGSVELDQLTFPGGDPISIVAEGGFDSGALHAQLSIADGRGALANAGATLHLDWPRLREHPDQLQAMLLKGPWQVSGETIARRLDRMPRPIPELAPYPAAIATRFALRKDSGDASGSIDFNLGWQQAFDVAGCAPGTQAQADGHITIEHGSSTISAKVFAGKAQVGAIEIGLDSPIERWLENARIDRPHLLRGNANFEVAAMQEVPYLCEYGNGSMRAQLEVDNALTSTPTLAVSVDARFSPKVARQAGRSQMRQRGCEDDPIRMRLYAKADSSELSGSGQLEGCHGGAAEMNGRMAVRWDRFLVLPSAREDGPVEGLVRFDGAHLEPVLDRIPGVLNAGAVARGEVEISGTPRHTRTSGQIDITAGHMYLVATGQELNEIDARVSFRGDWAKLDYLKASAGKGRLEAAGGFDFEGIRPSRARLALRARKLPIKREGLETAQITGSGVLDADIGKEGSRVALELHDLAVSLPETSGRTLQGLDPNPDVVIVTQAEVPRVRSYPIDFRIRGERQIRVRRSDFNTSVTIDLAVHWQPPDLNVGGSIAFTEGDFEVFGKRFQINSGALRFNGESEFNPDVYLAATEKPEASGLSPVYVSVTGTLAEPEVTFSSDACPGESGAITYMLSGRCDADDQDLLQESTDAQSAFTSGVLSGVLTLGAQSQLKDFAPRVALGQTAAGNQRAGLGFASETLIPKFMRKLVHRVYIEGAVAGTANQNATAPETANESVTPDFLIELYFPHNIVGSGRFSPVTWGVDALWEP